MQISTDSLAEVADTGRSCSNVTKCLTFFRVRIRQNGYCCCYYLLMMYYIDVLIKFPWVGITSGYSVLWSDLFLVARSDSCSAYIQPWQVFFLLNLLRINLSHNLESIVRMFMIRVLKPWLSYKLCKRRCIINNYDSIFLGFATYINVLSTTRYFKEHYTRNTLTYIRNIRRLLNFTEDLAQYDPDSVFTLKF